MKAEIHPEYRVTEVTCICGASYKVAATKADMRVEICSNCHPFYTGKQRIVDTGGRVERFRRKYKGYAESRGKGQSAGSADKGQDGQG